MTDLRDLDGLLRATDGDAGCTAGAEILERTSNWSSPARTRPRFTPARRSTFESCPGCRADHDGLLEAARRFGHIRPE